MLEMLSFLLKAGTATQKAICPPRDPCSSYGMPDISPNNPCQGSDCSSCMDLCPTDAIEIKMSPQTDAEIALDLGACLACGLCVTNCPTGTLVNNLSTRVSVQRREQLLKSNKEKSAAEVNQAKVNQAQEHSSNPFRRSLSIRVVSTGCTACDLEIQAAFNPIFDIERFGINLVASPRAADALVITGPVPAGMHKAVLRTYEAMSDPKLVIAVGSCAISGGIHRGGYTSANGAGALLPIDIYVPGCPPHPWSIIDGLMKAMGRVD